MPAAMHESTPDTPKADSASAKEAKAHTSERMICTIVASPRSMCIFCDA